MPDRARAAGVSRSRLLGAESGERAKCVHRGEDAYDVPALHHHDRPDPPVRHLRGNLGQRPGRLDHLDVGAHRVGDGDLFLVYVGERLEQVEVALGHDPDQLLQDDPRTKVVVLYLESFGNPRKFARLAPRVARTKPIVAVRSGRSAAGTRAASSHSAALASLDVGVDALFAQAGVIRTSTLEELFDVVALLSSQPVPKGARIGVVTNAGGPGILLADACEAHGLSLPPLSDATLARLRAVLPPQAGLSNPIDMIASASMVAGLGGVHVELFRDVAFRLTPVSELDAAEMLDELRARALLDGFRGSPPADRDALVRTILRIGGLVEAMPEIAELDLNPVMVFGRGEGAIAVDGRLRLATGQK